ncbi:MAG: thiamine pyrophosphate-binding protein, partial [Chryseolinea sp.]
MTNRFQPVYNIAELCARRRLNNVVICPGSRSAPLVLAFTRHPEMKCRLISDERSAAFIALGISQNCKLPTVLIRTSGTAAYNFAP